MSTIYNSDNFNLTDWDLTLPINSSNGTTGTAETISNLTDFTSPYFYGNADGSMTFNAPVVGATTNSTFGAGSGLNELNSAGAPAGWNLATGGTMSAMLEVNSVPTLTTGGEGKVIIGQVMVQNSNIALAQLYYDAGNIYFKNTLYSGQQDTYQLTDAAGNHPTIGLNQKFSYELDAHGSTLTVKVNIGGDTYSSVTSIDSSWQSLPLYFKAGVFDGDAGTSGTSLPQATGAGQATFYGLDMSHTAGDGLGGLQAPVATTDSFTGAANTVITGNMLTNDTAPAGLTLSVAPATQTTVHGGAVVENANGTFTYTPATGFAGVDSFAYTLKDGSGLSSTGTVNLTIGASTLSPPVAHPDNVTGTENQPITGNVLTNDTDPNGLALSVTPATLTTAHGSVVENANGTFTYTPAIGYIGSDTFNYTLNDTAGLSSTGVVNVAVTAPSVPAGYSLVFDPSFSTLSLESSANKSGTWDTTFPYASPGSASFSGRTLSSNNEAEFYSDPTVGVNPFSVNNGVMTITAAAATSSMLATEAAANGGKTLPYTSGMLTTYTSFDQTYGLYEITAKMPAGQGLWPALWFLPTSGAWPPEIDLLEEIGNQPTTDYMTLHTGTSNTAIGVTSQVPTMTTGFNTYAVDWEPTTITFYINGKQVAQEATPSDMHQPMYLIMNLAVGGTGSWPGAPNSATVFPAQMQISSVQVYASPNTIADVNTVGVQTTNLPPVAQPDNVTGTENKVITGNVLTNDSDPNGLALSVTAATITTAHGGTVVQNADGTFTYTPATNYVGTDTFNYTLKDSAGLSSTGTVNLTVTAPTYLPPVAQPDSFTGQENQVVTGNVLTNDTDPNGLALSVTAATIATTHGGTVVQNADGTFTYTPATGFSGTDTFNYTLKDTAGLSSTGTATITVNAPTYLPPVASPDTFTGQENHVVTGNVLTNDTDPNGLALSVTAATITTAHGGTVVQNADGTFTYTPATNFSGTDTFNYTLKDTAGLTATGAATITVNAPPVATPDTFTGTENKVITGNVMTNDSDPNGLALSVTAATLTTAHGGTVVQNANGTFTYTPAMNFVGTDTFNYTLKDSAGLSSTGTATLTVAAPALLPPVAHADSFTGTENAAITGNVLLNDTDPNGLALSIAAATLTTAHGKVVENADGTFTYTPAANFSGTDSFNYTLKDTAGLSSIGTVNVTVNASSTAPVAHTDNFTSSKNDPMFGNVLANNGNGADTDPNGQWLSIAAATLKTAHGASVTEASDGTVTYIPAANFVGTDTFNYTLKDGAGHSSTGTVNVTVAPLSTTGVVTFGPGSNMLFGGDGGPGGSDTYVFKAANLGTGVDTIRDFSLAQNDKIDISNVLSGHYNPATQILSNFVHIATSGSNSIVEVDLTGHAGAAGWSQVTTLFSVTNLNEQSLVSHGNLIV